MDKYHYYICKFKLDGKDRYIIWYGGDRDGILLGEEDKIVALDSFKQVVEYAQKEDISIVAESIPIYKFDVISSWCSHPSIEEIDCREFLNMWNIFIDLASSIGSRSQFNAVDLDMGNLYDKFFYGNNLLSKNSTKNLYEPSWSEYEIYEIANLFMKGVQDLRAVMPA
jgi:hypothetical protein